MASTHIKTAFDQIRRSPFQATAAIFVLSLTFFVTTLLSVLVYSSHQALVYFETRPQIIAFIAEDADEAEINALRDRLLADSRVKEVNYVTKEQALEIYRRATSDNPLLAELVDPSIFPASLEFSVKDIAVAEGFVEDVKKEAIVEQVGFTASLGDEESLNDVVQRLSNVTGYIRIGGIVFVTLLLSTSFLVLLIIIGMRMTAKRVEVEILNLIGATGAFIRNPIILEALVYAVTGVLIGWLTALVVVLYATPNIISYFGDIPVLPRGTTELLIKFGAVLAGEILIGIFLALSGSLLAVSRTRRS